MPTDHPGVIKPSTLHVRRGTATGWNGPERSRVPTLTSRCGVDVSGEGAHHSKIAVLLGVIEAVADHELVRYVEPDVPDLEIYLHGFRFPQQGADLDRGRTAR